MNAARERFVKAVHEAYHNTRDAKCCGDFDEAVVSAMDDFDVEPLCIMDDPAKGEDGICHAIAEHVCSACDTTVCAGHAMLVGADPGGFVAEVLCQPCGTKEIERAAREAKDKVKE